MFEGLKVLFVEDDPAVRLGSQQALQLAGLEVQAYDSAEQVRKHIVPDFAGVLVSDVKLPGMDGLGLLRHAKTIDPNLPVILVTGHGDISMAVQAIREGAYDFIEKPFSSEHLSEVVKRALDKRKLTLEVLSLRRKLENRQGIGSKILGYSPAIESLRRTILDLSDTDVDVLILGETGTGKELVARCLHEHGSRQQNNFVAINCGGMPETLFESEVFGYEAGAFTGALKRRIGKIEHAGAGTLFLDEIESMPLSLQSKLLRTLQERQFERLGSNELIPMNCRVLTASACKDLRELCSQQRFRIDLFYRLSVLELTIPPLRERREDIPLLFEHFVMEAAQRYNREAPALSKPQLNRMLAYDWPGNVRELRNIAARFVLGMQSSVIGSLQASKTGPRSLGEQVDLFERHLIEEALRSHSGRASAASEALGLPKQTLYDKMRRFGLSTDDFKG
ncbi:MAG: sigma-54-dependent Fis family transcriptional regulator [Deltaproteobacteria bacterium]|nr:sigma-54-dependent Fis family transcriptional regulator [Deltaproteobacteria bacterium]